MKQGNLKFRQYFLGSLNEKESEELGLQIIENESVEEQLIIAENELMEDFLDKNLTPAEEKLFYANFLTCRERQDQLAQIISLRNYAKNQPLTEKQNIIAKKPSSSFGDKLKIFFINYSRSITVVAAGLIICLIVGLSWRLIVNNSNSGASQLEQEYTELNKKDLSDSTETAVILASGILRDSSSAKKITSENLPERIFFRLALPFQINGTTALKAQVFTNQKLIFTQNQVRIYQSQNGQEIKIFLPKSILTKGNYQINLENPGAEASPITYSFVVD